MMNRNDRSRNMKKIGPILAILSGVFIIIISMVGIFVERGIIASDTFIRGITSSATKRATANITIIALYYVAIIISSLMIVLG